MEDAVGKTLSELQTPCFLVDIDILKRNCDTMRERSEKLGLTLRPHMKTHKTLEAGELMTNGTKRCVVVSTVKEAEFFADGGFDDILYAYAFTEDKLKRLQKLSERLELFHVLVDNVYGIELLENTPLKHNKKWNVFLKVNCGNDRVGMEWVDPDLPVVAKRIATSDCMTFRGVYAHDGNNYYSRGATQVSGVADETAEKLLQVKNLLTKHDIKCDTVATGSTPSCSKPGKLMSQLTEMHPGNYVFMDSQQCMIGSCKKGEVAGRVMTRIIGHYPTRNQMLVDSGFLALSHDGHKGLPSGSYCIVDRHPNLNLVKMTQEVGVIETNDDSMLNFSLYPIGSVLYLLPYHSCATAALHPSYYVHSRDKVVSIWKPCRGW